MTTRRARGRATEETVAEYLRGNGFPQAERRPASLPGSDVMGTPGIDWEVKARRSLDLLGLMRQLGRRAEEGQVPVGVVRPDGAGPTSVHRWPVVMPLEVAVRLLRAAGYGEAQ